MEMLYAHNNSNDRRKRPRRNILNQPSYSLSNNHHHAIMKFLHHRQCRDKVEQPPLQSPSMSLTKQVDAVQDEFIAVISVMQESESSTGAYDPMGRYSYSDKDDKLLSSTSPPLVNVDCRSRMLSWCSNMIGYFEVDRSIIAIALYYQDRFLGTKKGKAVQNDRSLFRVVSVTSLYMALKIYVPERWNITPQAFSKLCQGTVTAKEINDMETNILFALDWHVNPPSPMQYVKALLDLIFYSTSKRISPELREHILELVSYQLDTALDDMRLIQVRSSTIATASLLNALEGVMKEGHPEDTSEALFDQDCIDLVLGIIQSEGNELRYVQSILLGSVVSTDDDRSSSQENEKSDAECSVTEVVERSTESSSPQSVSSPPPSKRVSSSSPTSTSKIFQTQSKVCSRTLTPQSVLSKVVAHHFI